VATWKHLETALTNQNCVYGEIKSRTCSGNACYPSVQKLSSSHLLSKYIKDSKTQSYNFSCCLTDVWNFVSHLCHLSVRHPQHTQTSSNSSTIAAERSNGVTITRCCRYNCLRSWWWMEVPPETCRQFPDKINCVTLHLVGYILEYYYDARTHER
jgi:hypothetical protein